MNLLAVAAGIGAVVAVFQLGWLNGLVGLERSVHGHSAGDPAHGVLLELRAVDGLRAVPAVPDPAGVPPSMRTTTARPSRAWRPIAPVITGAGLIMVVVFGAFVGARAAGAKDDRTSACASRCWWMPRSSARFIVPAVMAIGGRWNWYPGRRAALTPERRGRLRASSPCSRSHCTASANACVGGRQAITEFAHRLVAREEHAFARAMRTPSTVMRVVAAGDARPALGNQRHWHQRARAAAVCTAAGAPRCARSRRGSRAVSCPHRRGCRTRHCGRARARADGPPRHHRRARC